MSLIVADGRVRRYGVVLKVNALKQSRDRKKVAN